MSDPHASNDHSRSENSIAPGQGAARLFAVVFVVLSLALLSQISVETKFSSGKSLFAQPRFWPAVGVGGMLLFGLFHLISVRQKSSHSALREVGLWLRACEYVVWFMVYVQMVSLIGYLLATLIFTALLAWRQGYRTKAGLLSAAGAGFLVVFVFKTLLHVKIPGGAIYGYLPAAMRSFMIVNF